MTRGQFGLFVKDDGYQTEAEQGKGGIAGRGGRVGKFEGPDKKYSWKNTSIPQTDLHPVVNVTWNDAKMFCTWLPASGVERKLFCRARHNGNTLAAQEQNLCISLGTTRSNWLTTATCADGTGKEKFPEWSSAAINAKDGYAFTAPVGNFEANRFGTARHARKRPSMV